MGEYCERFDEPYHASEAQKKDGTCWPTYRPFEGEGTEEDVEAMAAAMEVSACAGQCLERTKVESVTTAASICWWKCEKTNRESWP